MYCQDKPAASEVKRGVEGRPRLVTVHRDRTHGEIEILGAKLMVDGSHAPNDIQLIAGRHRGRGRVVLLLPVEQEQFFTLAVTDGPDGPTLVTPITTMIPATKIIAIARTDGILDFLLPLPDSTTSGGDWRAERAARTGRSTARRGQEAATAGPAGPASPPPSGQLHRRNLAEAGPGPDPAGHVIGGSSPRRERSRRDLPRRESSRRDRSRRHGA